MKIKIPSLKNNFSGEILKRGYEYYKEGRVKNLILDGKKASAVVIGNRDYRVTIDLAKNLFKCTCPCDFNCKHAAAVLYELRKNSEVETVGDLRKELNKKSKEPRFCRQPLLCLRRRDKIKWRGYDIEGP